MRQKPGGGMGFNFQVIYKREVPAYIVLPYWGPGKGTPGLARLTVTTRSPQ
jgi:hypothetical protein